jgi:hypothetical protein
LEAEGIVKHKVTEGGRGDVEPKKLKLVEECKAKPDRVWLQGYVVNVSKDCKCFEISDSPETETGAHYPAKSGSKRYSVFIVNCANAPAGINHSMKGKYCQVLGDVSNFDQLHGHLRVLAIKIADLSKLENCETLKAMWTHEVLEARKVENNLIKFQI